MCVLSGGNNDVSRYAEVVERALVHTGRKHYFLVEFPQEPGALRRFLDDVLGPDDDITLFEYVKRNNRETGPALVGIELGSADDLPAAAGPDGRRAPEHRADPARQPALPLPPLTADAARSLTRRRAGSGDEEAVRDELADADGRGVLGDQRVGRPSEQRRQRAEDLARGQVAVAGPDEGRLDGVDLPGPAHPPLLAQHDDLGILRAGRADGLLPHVLTACATAVPSSSASVEAGQQVGPRRNQSSTSGPSGCSTS